jgi:hypothetical protein
LVQGKQISDYETRIKQLEKQQSDGEYISTSKINDYMGQILKQNKEIENLNNEINGLKQDNNKLEQEKQQEVMNNNIKNAIISRLKIQADMEPLKAIIKNWVDFIDKGKYEDAYKLQNNAPASQGSAKNLSEFTDYYKRSVKSIKVKSIDLLSEGLPDNKKGDIIFKAAIEVIKLDNSESDELIEGLNEMYFTMSVDENRNDWVISSISHQLN